jgi:hypothetical protein
MLTELKDIWARLKIHWHALAVAGVAMLPTLLYQLEGIDLRPILSHFLPEHYVELIIAMLPFVLLVMKPMLHLEEPEDE